jgi:DNA adenine methylase
MLEDLHSRLSGVVIECLDWSEFLRRYDGPGKLFYLDPPYWGCETDYGKALFSRDDFAAMAMAEALRGLKGRFILSINDVPEIRKTFAGFAMVEIKTTYTIGKTNDQRPERAELLISNFRVGG